jgi:hypothetical protein
MAESDQPVSRRALDLQCDQNPVLCRYSLSRGFWPYVDM